ncbi:MAG: hypothetical protein ABR562_06955, partial [Thermoplasmatota archaeon]
MSGDGVVEGIVEGATRLFVPGVNKNPRGPGRREKGAPFYNPGMALNRDLSVLLAEAEGRRKGREIDFADALAGTGARSVRVAHEVEVPLIVHANDGNPLATAAIRQAAKANEVPAQRLEVVDGDAYAFLASRRHDVVDVDPHGSPMPFMDAALRATRPDGILCVTATDTGALAGTFPRVARRRYDAHHGLHKAAWKAEAGLRILAGAVVRSAARFDRTATPVLCVTQGHWMRVMARVDGAKKDADLALKALRNAVLDPTGGGRFLDPHESPGKGTAWGGPMWSGPLHDCEFVAALAEALGPERVHCVSMPSQFSSEATRADARRLAESLGCPFTELPIEPIVEAFRKVLAEPFG